MFREKKDGFLMILNIKSLLQEPNVTPTDISVIVAILKQLHAFDNKDIEHVRKSISPKEDKSSMRQRGRGNDR